MPVCRGFGERLLLGLGLGLFRRDDRDLGRRAAAHRQKRTDLPELFGLELLDLAFAVDDEADGDRLHPAGTQMLGELAAQQRAELVADDPVQEAAGFLRRHAVHINGAGAGKCTLHGRLGDLVERHAPSLGVGQGQRLLQVPGDGLAFAVRVGGEIDRLGRRGLLLQPGQQFLAVLQDAVGRHPAVFDVDAEAALGQVADMALARHDVVIRPQILIDGLRLRRRFDDHEVLFLPCGHNLLLNSSPQSEGALGCFQRS